jgi:tetratricopeptide (TPR) repeat protein
MLKRAAEAGNSEALEHLHALAEQAESAGSFYLARVYYLLTLSLTRRLPDSERMFKTALHNLAEMYRRHGRRDEAEPLFLAALDIAQRLEGQSRMLSALTLNNLGLLYKEAGEYAKAEPLYLRALAIYEHSPSASAEDFVRTLNGCDVMKQAPPARTFELR